MTVRIYRLSVERRGRRTAVQWLGPVHTYDLWPRWRVKDRANW